MSTSARLGAKPAGSPPKAHPRRGRPEKLSPEQSGNRTVVLGLQLLKALVHERKPVALTRIADLMDISPSRSHRYLAALCEAGFVKKDEDTGRYGVGIGAIELGLAALSSVKGMDLATQAMEDLTAATGLVSYLCVWGANGPTILRREQGSVQTAVRIRVGSNLSMLTATGQVFLAHLPEAQTRGALLRDIAEWNASGLGASLVTQEQAMKLSQRVRTAGIARSTGMRNPTWTAFSVPVFNGGRFAMALTLIGVSRLFDTRLDGEAAVQLRQAAASISTASVDW